MFVRTQGERGSEGARRRHSAFTLPIWGGLPNEANGVGGPHITGISWKGGERADSVGASDAGFVSMSFCEDASAQGVV